MTAPRGLSALGIVTPIGRGKDAVALALFAGTRGGLRKRDDLISGRAVHVGAVDDALPPVPPALRALDCRNNRLFLAALNEIAGEVAAAAAHFGPHRVAVVLGTSTSGIAGTEAAYAHRRETGVWPADFDYRQHEAGGLAEFAAACLGLTGLAYTITTACSSSAKVFAAARRLIDAGLCDAAIVGGCDTLCRMTVNGFGALEALSPGLCNPFSVNRDGINIGEGAAAFLMRREEAEINLLGIGETSDGYHISAPDPAGHGAVASMTMAIADAGLAAADIAYINLHGTGTQLNDVMEGKSVASVFPTGVACSSTKALTGHMLGAAGAVEAAFLWLSLHSAYGDRRLPPHLWDGAADPAIPSLALVPPGTRMPDTGRGAMLTNSFAFGGSNASLVLGRTR